MPLSVALAWLFELLDLLDGLPDFVAGPPDLPTLDLLFHSFGWCFAIFDFVVCSPDLPTLDLLPHSFGWCFATFDDDLPVFALPALPALPSVLFPIRMR